MNIVHHITNRPTYVVECLQEHFLLTQQSVKDLLELGAIYSDKKRIFEDRLLEKGTYLRIHLHPRRFPVTDIDWKKIIIADEKDFIVINKPKAVPTHALVDNGVENCLEQMRKVTADPLFITQRLDIPVSGLLLLAKSQKFQTLFNRYLAERRVIKIYQALTNSEIPVGRYLNYMEPSDRSPKRMSKDVIEGWQPCELSVLSSQKRQDNFELLVELHTGRTHQIRAQLALLGAPILNDKMYGGKGSDESGIGLECRELSFPYLGGHAHFKL